MSGEASKTTAASGPPAADNTTDPHERHWHDIPSAAYLLPNDSPEHQRLNAQAVHLSNLLKQRLTHAPVDASTATALLDVGCGTGIVTRYMSQRYPRATAYGVDLSPVPSSGALPPNVKFVQGDVLTQTPSQWVAADGQSSDFKQEEGVFDLIFSRLLIFGIADWPGYAKRAFDLLKPGGWVEFQDIQADYYDLDGNDLSKSWPWHDYFVKLWTPTGLDIRCGLTAKDYLAKAGFEDIQQTLYQYPVGSRGHLTQETRDFAAFNEKQLPEILGLSLQRMSEGKIPQEEIDDKVGQLKATFDPDRAMYMPYIVTTARKPL